MAFGAATDTGKRRVVNEDAFLADAPLFLVADGMGGYAAGAAASAAVVDVFSRHVGEATLSITQMQAAYGDAARVVGDLPVSNGVGPGTTLTGVVVAVHDGAGYWLVVNVGDSRTYRMARGQLEQISVDHSVVQEMVDEGRLTVAEAANDRRRNLVTRAIGAGAVSEADFWLIPAAEGDRILVCSDGLSNELDDQAIAEILRGESEAQVAAVRLVKEACARGGRDNITAVVVDAVWVARDGELHLDEDTVPRGAGQARNPG